MVSLIPTLLLNLLKSKC